MRGRGRSAALALIVLGVSVLLGARYVAANDSSHASSSAVAAMDPDSGLIVHEWGTFTSVAGVDGRATAWLPLAGHSDLPCFVKILNPTSVKDLVPRVQATVRMETPVLYFYSRQPRTVQVKVRFPHGLITEWYPNATVPAFVVPMGLDVSNSDGAIEWKDVHVQPGADWTFPSEDEASHYYAARATDASPVEVDGQREKFLFYRGLATFPLPVTARALDNGQVVVNDVSAAPISVAILFEKRGSRIGYRVVRDLRDQVTLDAPALDATFSGLTDELQRTLTAEGLYPREAAAMIETWRDSWFENGTRLFYLVPRPRVDSILPLTVAADPAATSVRRVFVGRLEVITPSVMSDASAALARHDTVALLGYGRALGEILGRIRGRAGFSNGTSAQETGVDAATFQRPDNRCTGFLGRVTNHPVRRY